MISVLKLVLGLVAQPAMLEMAVAALVSAQQGPVANLAFEFQATSAVQ